MAAIAFRGVTFGRGGRRLLDGVDWTLEPGEIALATGATGAGKTALLDLCALETSPEAGEIEVLGARRAEAALRRRIGRAAQAPDLMPHMTAAENVALPLRLAGLAPAARKAQAEELLAWLGLPAERAAALPATLSAGERRLTELARAAAGGGDLILLDDPTGDLDDDGAEKVAEMLIALAAHGAAVVAATGDDAFARGLLRRPETRPLRLEAGRLVGRAAG
ncbi:MAG: ATP-binding cassette domain-containing protein [Paracoccaceae bacterium]